ncbi:glycosyltransferase [Catenovulum maritimum]|uniref:glycosyltransferase n=1 Tax=Catenovulum maritimum TaxID=1513271 RepID=UPI00066129EA|nr:glycosyltransferase [Catenovulum maritimum]
MNLKHIGVVVGEFPVPSETFIINELNGLAEIGHPVTVFCFKHHADRQVILASDINVVEIGAVAHAAAFAFFINTVYRLHYAINLTLRLTCNPSRSLFWHGLKLAYLLHKFKCEHIHCHFFHHTAAHGLVAKAFVDLPVSIIGHGHDIYQDKTNLTEKLTECDLPIAVCTEMKKDFDNLVTKSTALIPCGIDLTKFNQANYTHTTQKKMLFVGRVVAKKGLNYLIEALSYINPDIRPKLDIVGAGEMLIELEQMVVDSELSEYVNFLGFKPHSWLIDHCHEYDVFIAPFCIAMTGDRDTGPLALKEAMALGLPVITTSIMGCPDIVGTQAGFLIPEKNAQALASCISQFYRMSYEQRFAMSRQARNRVEAKFNVKDQVKALSNKIEAIHV